MELFERWLDSHKVKHAVKVDTYVEDGGYCLVAAKDLSPGETTLEIPEHLFMSYQSAKQASSFADVYRILSLESKDPMNLLNLDDIYDSITQETLILMLFLLHERSKRDTSLWHPYINLLPCAFSTPLFFTPIELSLLEASPIRDLALSIRRSLHEIHAQVVPPLVRTFGDTFLHPSDATLESFMWAYTVIESRAFKLNLTGSDSSTTTTTTTVPALTTVLVPCADLANHVATIPSATLHSKDFDPVARTFQIACADVGARVGEELTLRYNNLANWQLLLHYGFTMLDNPFDRVNLSFEIPTDAADPRAEVRKAVLLRLGESAGLGLEHSVQAAGVAGTERVIGEGLMGSLRLLLMSAEELERWDVNNLDKLVGGPASEGNEEAVLETLRNLFEGMRDQYPTTLRKDWERYETARGGGNISKGETYALVYLIGQKQILEDALVWVEAQEKVHE
ncbi:hypothetical protein BC937DRAFT_90534 [Endogone sp. FLAS-F59071]|nr:hypothetical protein BC937DRAFT_90534 [Endogone sp. FLAS-F59071]|eukprot:RUS17016.1 hypothetical protein BC937DRAFT_90534 [Endogone sp. FLAS-F59071]